MRFRCVRHCTVRSVRHELWPWVVQHYLQWRITQGHSSCLSERAVLCQRYEGTGGIKQMGTHNRSENGRSAWVALFEHPTHTDTGWYWYPSYVTELFWCLSVEVTKTMVQFSKNSQQWPTKPPQWRPGLSHSSSEYRVRRHQTCQA
jgi:hypothetical protein